jgi:hypothetical protein
MAQEQHYPLSSITLDDYFLVRGKPLDADTVDRYAEQLEAGDLFPPVVLWHESGSGKSYLVDGRHRHAAHIQLARTHLLAIFKVFESRAEALMFAAAANVKHGLPLTNDEKRAMVKKLLSDPACAKLSDRMLADNCHVSNRFVGDMRRELEGVTGTHLAERIGKDGKTYTVPPKPKPEEPLSERGQGTIVEDNEPRAFTDEEMAQMDHDLAADMAALHAKQPNNAAAPPVAKNATTETPTPSAASPVAENATVEFTIGQAVDYHTWGMENSVYGRIVIPAKVVKLTDVRIKLEYFDPFEKRTVQAYADRKNVFPKGTVVEKPLAVGDAVRNRNNGQDGTIVGFQGDAAFVEGVNGRKLVGRAHLERVGTPFLASAPNGSEPQAAHRQEHTTGCPYPDHACTCAIVPAQTPAATGIGKIVWEYRTESVLAILEPLRRILAYADGQGDANTVAKLDFERVSKWLYPIEMQHYDALHPKPAPEVVAL